MQADLEHVWRSGWHGLEDYLEAASVDVWFADHLTIVPEPTTLLLALTAVPL